jgi:hypothetical protein
MHLFSFLLFMLFAVSLEGREVIKENIAKAGEGDWLAIALDRNFSFYRVLDNNGSILHLEEVCISARTFKRQCISWRDWASRGYPGMAGRNVYRIDVLAGRLTNSTNNAFLSTLMNLDLKKIPEMERIRAGRPLFNSGPTDTRAIWQPKLVYNGQQVMNASFDAYKARWPQDHSEMAGKLIEVYLPKEGEPYPSYFPYFMQVFGVIGKAKMHIVDSGRF